MLIPTTRGQMDDSLLEKKEFAIDNDVETTAITEYWHGGMKGCPHRKSKWVTQHGHFFCGDCDAEQVHRSIDMKLKKAATFAEGVAALFG